MKKNVIFKPYLCVYLFKSVTFKCLHFLMRFIPKIFVFFHASTCQNSSPVSDHTSLSAALTESNTVVLSCVMCTLSRKWPPSNSTLVSLSPSNQISPHQLSRRHSQAGGCSSPLLLLLLLTAHAQRKPSKGICSAQERHLNKQLFTNLKKLEVCPYWPCEGITQGSSA